MSRRAGCGEGSIGVGVLIEIESLGYFVFYI